MTGPGKNRKKDGEAGDGFSGFVRRENAGFHAAIQSVLCGYACMSAGKTLARRKKILLTQRESCVILLSAMEFRFCGFAGVAQLVEQLIRNQ